ncbi:MAG: hypothetical protein C0407_02000 [Desulfobacca sp.]|nr:hypothetical protein [Desulfobacca sp.]
MDVNADQKTDTQELKFGAGFMINSLLFAKDQDGNQLLSLEETGVSPGTISLLDTDADNQVSAGEMITTANRIIDGLVPILDMDGDGALSRAELGIFELLFSSGPAEVAQQDSSSLNVNEALDLNTIPDRMRQAGFQGSDNLLYYVLGSTYADWPWQPDPADPDAMRLSAQRGDIYEWFDKIVMNVADKMEANPEQTVTAIINDGPDRLGFRLGPAIMEKLTKFGDRAQIGTIYV